MCSVDPVPVLSYYGRTVASAFEKPELDAVRFLAFCLVFCNHVDIESAWLPMRTIGAFGMPLFFLLSAFLIVSLLLREKQQTKSVALKSFFIRRALRIWPLYYSLLAFGFVFGHFYRPAFVPHAAMLAMAVSLGNVWVARYGWHLSWMAPLWSLSLEEQFYLGIPSVVRLATRRALFVFFLLIVAASYLTLVWLAIQRAIPVVAVWTNSFVQFQFFAAGGLLALWASDHTVSLRAPGRVALAAAGLCLWYLESQVCRINATTPLPAAQLLSGYALVLLGTLAVFLAFLDLKATVPQALRYLGRITYGLYVFHEMFLWLVLDAPARLWFPQSIPVRLIGAAAATFLVAALSYRFLEKPFLRFKYRFEVVHSRPA